MSKKNRSKTELKLVNYAIGVAPRYGDVENRKTPWFQCLELLSKPEVDNNLSLAQYLALDPVSRAQAKCGPFIVGGPCKGGKRKRENVEKRYILILDVDNATPGQFEFIKARLSEIYRYAHLVHTTRSHTPKRPKFRVYIPLDSPVDDPRFEPVSRIMASLLFDTVEESMDAVDEASFRIAQLMYLPSISKDQEFYHHVHDGPLLSADKLLEDFDGDWRDFTQLPWSEKRAQKRRAELGVKAEDPTTKIGIVGAFCRVYDILTAIAEFLPDIYTPGNAVSAQLRYTYEPGTGSNGAIVYGDGLFLYSHHGSDPCGDKLVNAFDMVRIHLFGNRDKGRPESTSPTKLPSFRAMVEMLEDDKAVMKELAESNVPAAAFEDVENDDDEVILEDCFEDLLGPEPKETRVSASDFEHIEPDTPKENKKKKDREWAAKLVRDGNGKLKKTRANVARIICNDVRIAPCIATNALTGAPHLMRKLNFPDGELHQAPVPKTGFGRPWNDTDTTNVMVALSEDGAQGGYGVDFPDGYINSGMLLAAQKNVFDPIRTLMTKEEWDGVPRIDSFLIDFFGAEDTPYHRECAHIMFMGAVLRTFEPGAPFRLVVVLEGEEDIGKSGAIQVLAFGEYSTTLSGNFENTQALVEQQRNAFLVELGELSGLRRSAVEDIKRHLSEIRDIVRLAYRKNEEHFRRRCIFIGTTNADSYLKDPSSNTRFLPVKCRIPAGNTVDFKRLQAEVHQLWAEGVHRYHQMRLAQPDGALIIKLEAEEAKVTAKEMREGARMEMPHEMVAEVVSKWLDKEVPLSETRDDVEFEDVREVDDGARYVRAHVTVAMVEQELSSNAVIRNLWGNKANIISQALKSLPNWEQVGRVRRGGKQLNWYGRKGVTTSDLWVEAEDPNADLLG